LKIVNQFIKALYLKSTTYAIQGMGTIYLQKVDNWYLINTKPLRIVRNTAQRAQKTSFII